MSGSEDLYRAIAVGAAAAAAVALLLLIWLGYSVHRLRRAQKVVLGDRQRDLIGHAESLERDFAALRDWLEDAAGRLEGRMDIVEARLDGVVAYRAMIRYDAYGEMTGRQSSTVALLDEHRSGVVLSSIRHRNHSHVYVKQLTAGESDIELSPEEQQAVAQALAQGPIAKRAPVRPPEAAPRPIATQSGDAAAPSPAAPAPAAQPRRRE